MRFAMMLLAAMAAFWTAQPAKAATYLYVGGCCLLNPVLETMTVNDATPGAAIVAILRGEDDRELLGYADDNGIFNLQSPIAFERWNQYGFFSMKIAAFNPETIGTYNHKWQLYSISNASYSGLPAPPVPEPATWAMMILGFAAIGVALRRRQGGPVHRAAPQL